MVRNYEEYDFEQNNNKGWNLTLIKVSGKLSIIALDLNEFVNKLVYFTKTESKFEQLRI